MKKDLGPKASVYPMPVLMIGTYDSEGKVDVMNAAWGQTVGPDEIFLCLSDGHKTTKNLLETKAFTVALADAAHVREADFLGMASGNTMEDKFERSGLTAEKSKRVNAPVILEFPVTMECELVKTTTYGLIGRVVNVIADAECVDEKGRIDAKKAGIILFDQFDSGYYLTGEKVGRAWNSGKELLAR